METEEFVSLLNEDLEFEYQSIVQYITRVATLKGSEYRSFADELATHVSAEVDHALALARQIDFLGGVPTTAVPEIPPIENDPAEELRNDLELEETQLQRYRERVGQAEKLSLPDVAETLAPVLQQTQGHVRDLRAVLG